MSRRVVRYEGEGRLRRPVYEDEGPASAAGRGHEPGSGRAAMARLGALATDRLIPTGGAGPIERRLVTDAQRAATLAVTEGERPAMGSAAHLQQSRMRGADRHVEVMTARRTPLITLADLPVIPPEEPMESPAAAERAELPIVVSLAESRIHALEELQSAALEAQEAVQEHQAAETAMAKAEEVHELALRRLSRAQDRVRDVLNPPAVTGEELQRAIASAVERHHEPLWLGGAPASTPDSHPDWTTAGGEDPGVAPADVPQGVLGDEELADDAPATVTRPAFDRDRSADLSPNQARVIEALTAAGGDFADAAAALRTSIQSVSTALRHIGEKGGIPIELIPLLPAAFAKYKPAGL